jgi:hypothetical protein
MNVRIISDMKDIGLLPTVMINSIRAEKFKGGPVMLSFRIESIIRVR